MADNYLITGYHGEPHVTAENDRGFNAAVFGSGKFVLPVGEMFRAEYIGNNTVRVYDGKLLNGGALAGIPAGKYIDFLIPEAGQGMNRNDLIVFEYSLDSSTLIESGVFKVVSGTETSGTAVDPVLHEEDILTDEATLDQMALLRVPVSGAVISAPESLFEIARNMKSLESYPHNHLVNSDFSNPVCSGTSGTASYTLDGWTANKLTITQEQYDIKTVPTATYAYIKQVVKVTPGKTYTCAARFSNAGVGEIRVYNTAISTQYAKVGKVSVVGMVSFTVPDGVNEIAVLLYPNAANVNSGIVYWAALYEGAYTAETLPEYHSRGYALEAAVCGVGGLNFKVVGGTTQPTNPVENTIWVNTSTTITDWAFNATQPTAVTGRVWIYTGASSPSEFNALKKNGIQVYPILAKQYVSGAWVDKEAKIYQGGAWSELAQRNYLFKSSEGAKVTMQFWKYVNKTKTNTTSTNITNDRIYFDVDVESYGHQNAVTTGTVDLTNIDTIHCEARQITKVGTGLILFIAPSGTNISAETYKKAVASKSIGTTDNCSIYELDVSSYSGGYIVGVGGFGTGEVLNMWY